MAAIRIRHAHQYISTKPFTAVTTAYQIKIRWKQEANECIDLVSPKCLPTGNHLDVNMTCLFKPFALFTHAVQLMHLFKTIFHVIISKYSRSNVQAHTNTRTQKKQEQQKLVIVSIREIEKIE